MFTIRRSNRQRGTGWAPAHGNQTILQLPSIPPSRPCRCGSSPPARRRASGLPGSPSGLRAAFEWVAEEPRSAQLLTNDALAGGSAGFERYERMVAYVAELLEPGREQAEHGERLPEITERAMASGVAMLVAQRLSMGKEAELPALAGEAIQFVLTPIWGASRRGGWRTAEALLDM